MSREYSVHAIEGFKSCIVADEKDSVFLRSHYSPRSVEWSLEQTFAHELNIGFFESFLIAQSLPLRQIF